MNSPLLLSWLLGAHVGSMLFFAAIVCTLVAAMFVCARLVLLPSINRARDRTLFDVPAAAQAFRRLHLQSVLINVLQFALLLTRRPSMPGE